MRQPPDAEHHHDATVASAPPASRVVLAVFAAFTLVAVLEATHAYVGHRYGYVSRAAFTSAAGEPLGLFDLILRQALSWWIFAVFALMAVRFTQLMPVSPERWLRTLLPHIVVSLLFPVAIVYTTTLVRYFVFLRGETELAFTRILANRLTLYYATNLLYYWAIVGVCSAFLFYGLYRERAIHQARLDRDLSDAQLRSLQAQLNPHFLFNTMNAVCGYALERNHEAVIGMLTRLSDLLRTMLRHRPTLTIPLSEELQVLETYIELQQMRLGPRLTVSVEVDERALSAVVPPLLLQPLVENAIQHGVEGILQGVVEITATCRNGTVVLEVADNGPGFGAESSGGFGLGMSATAERLQLIYGPRGRLETFAREGGGALVRVTVPYVPSNGTPRAERRHHARDYAV